MNTISSSIRFMTCTFVILLLISCEPEGHPKGWQVLDLLPYGPAVTVMAPPDAVIKESGLTSSILKDLTISGSDNYQLQVYYSNSLTNDIAKLKNDQLQIVRSKRYFRRMLKEEVAGFIYQSLIDSVETYSFNFTKLQGDIELNFQSGLSGIFTLEEVEMMYEGVK